jgi:hypothetical protein
MEMIIEIENEESENGIGFGFQVLLFCLWRF